MWQVLLAAAIAGSTGLVAKHLFSPNADRTANQPQTENPHESSPFNSPAAVNCCDSKESNYEEIFRFTSSGSSDNKKKKTTIGSSTKKKLGSVIACRRLKYDGVEKRSGGLDASGKRFGVCLKKRKTAKIAPAKCGSCSCKDRSLFGWGLGMGIMCMISTGKSEISKLNTAMDETLQVVEELRTELYKRKATQVAATKTISTDHTQLAYNQSSERDTEHSEIKTSVLPVIDEVECPSSVLSEEPEPEPEVLEMEQLEVELESELQKLPWSTSEASGPELIKPYLGKSRASFKEIHEPEGQSAVSYQGQGVLPSELGQKLCHLLIQQQENQISELGSELHLAQSKLLDKEAELEALKDCVRRLNEFSLATVSDEEIEVQWGQEHTSEWDSSTKMESESTKSVVGMKRPIDSAA